MSSRGRRQPREDPSPLLGPPLGVAALLSTSFPNLRSGHHPENPRRRRQIHAVPTPTDSISVGRREGADCPHLHPVLPLDGGPGHAPSFGPSPPQPVFVVAPSSTKLSSPPPGAGLVSTIVAPRVLSSVTCCLSSRGRPPPWALHLPAGCCQTPDAGALPLLCVCMHARYTGEVDRKIGAG
ncbi:hypothetical protein E2562_019985 [Oryza meyeriana var. granulata]|uniref:Uncharacterized protein n=1 Tax=Oryza meyeriana var. granulata TaxID=110450 RepID=A0A6G1CH35_9ORYZ|nr:hypothetical protein E2562_019985 [Oryza meyeriana var. granulata]